MKKKIKIADTIINVLILIFIGIILGLVTAMLKYFGIINLTIWFIYNEINYKP